MKMQENYWNQVADTKTFTTPIDLSLLVPYINKSSRILDFGCGYGRTLRILENSGYSNLYGADSSEKMIERAETENPVARYQVVKNNHSDFEDNLFDLVILFAVLTCIVDNKEQETLISEIKRILKPGGILYINDFLLNSDDRNRQRYQKYENDYHCYGVFELPEGAVLRHYHPTRIDELTSDFNKLSFETITFTTMNGNKSNGFNYIGSKGK